MFKIKGIRFSLFSIDLTKFDGYGFTLINLGIDTLKKITITKGGSLIHISFRKHYEYKGIMWKIHLNLFFFYQLHKTIKIIKEPENYCMYCEEYFIHEPFKIIKSKHVKENLHKYCSEECFKYSYDSKLEN